MNIASEANVAVGYGVLDDERSRVIEGRDGLSGEPFRLFLDKDTARQIVEQGLDNWFPASERAAIAARIN